jgi:hypothetical protein
LLNHSANIGEVRAKIYEVVMFNKRFSKSLYHYKSCKGAKRDFEDDERENLEEEKGPKLEDLIQKPKTS